jgi:hypothetical protein
MMNRITLPRLIIIIAAICAVVAFFLPYISATDEYRAYINNRSDEKPFNTVDITIGEMADMSLFTYAKTYFQGGEELLRSKGNGIFYGILMSAVAGFAVLIILTALGKKPMLTLIFDIFMAGSFYLINWDFIDRRIMPDNNRVWAISYHLYYPLAAIIAVCAIWMFVIKHKVKKEAKKVVQNQ